MADSSSDTLETDQQVDENQNAEMDTSSEVTDSGAETADSPAAKDEKQPVSMAEAVRDALAKPKDEQSSGSEGGKEDSPKTSEEDPDKAKADQKKSEDELGEPTEEEMNGYKDRTRRRMEWFQEQRQQLQGQVTERDQQIAQLKPAADSFQQIQEYCTSRGLSSEDVNNTFQIAGDCVSNPARALAALEPVVDQLRQIVGVTLPQDLQDQVERGEITEAAAQEISRARAHQTYTPHIRQIQQENHNRVAAQRNAAQLGQEVGTAISQWESSWKANDPDYQLKHARVLERIELAIMKGQQTGQMPRNAKEAVELAENIKQQVDAEFKKLAPKRQANTPVQSVKTATGSKPAPKSMLEAISQAVGQ